MAMDPSPGPGSAVRTFPVKTNYAVVVPKPGFQNRRNRSQYLKKLYPSGFGVSRARSETLLNNNSSYDLHHSSAPLMQLAPISFTGWTKGLNEDSLLTFDSLQDQQEDPFADCVGPTWKELASLRKNDTLSNDKSVQEESSCSVNKCRIFTKKDAYKTKVAYVITV
jgi:hypothetical protein